MDTTDYGKRPYVVNIEQLTKENTNFRTVKWTGTNLQMTLMSIEPNGEVGLEAHDTHDQFLRIEAGIARVVMGPSADNLDFERNVADDDAIFVPASTWHNIINTGQEPLKLYSIYAPAEHPTGTIHPTFADAEADKHDH